MNTDTSRVKWVQVLDAAREIAAEYEQAMTLRQLFYRLVVDKVLPNLQTYYRRLSAQTAAARREGTFPDLVDESRDISGGGGYTSPADALRWAADDYSRDRTEGQPYTLVLAVEKRGLLRLLDLWFGELDVLRVAVGGFDSQSHIDDLVRTVRAYQRPAILLYAGDFDPSGEDIERDFLARTDCWHEARRIALTPQQVADLPEYVPTEAELKKLRNDPRAKAFERRHGSLVQYEVDALPPDQLRNLYRTAIDDYWDEDAYQDVLDREATERAQLTALADEWDG
jgi:hypothetical protein